jgi:hypothetical protein
MLATLTGTLYTRSEIDTTLATITGSLYTSAQVDTILANATGSIVTMLGGYYTKTQIDALFVAPTISYTSIANQFNVSSVPTGMDFTITDNTGGLSVAYIHGTATGTLALSGAVYPLALSNTIGLHAYKITATDSNGNKTVETVTYNVVADSVTNVNIQGYTLSNLTATGVTISWDTDVISTDSKVDFYANGTSTLNQVATISGTTNTLTLNTLTANKTYTVKVKSKVTGQTNYTELTFTIKTATTNTGIAITNLSRISHGDVSVGADYGSGYHFRFAVTANNLTESGASLKLADWSNGASTIAIAANTKLAISASGYDSYAAATGSLVDVTNNYGNLQNISGIDSDDTIGGRQFIIDVFYKIPTGAAGAYSTSYGIKTE